MATILVVDDLKQVRMLLKACLEMSGHTVLTAGHGGEALPLCHAHPIDVMLIDRSMPTMDGLETIRRLRAEQPDGPPRIILMSGDDESCGAIETLDALGVQRVLKKPFGVAEVRQIVDAELATRSPGRPRDPQSSHIHLEP
ncbi:MAG: response regulator [Nitrospiraceae bacterium]